MGEGREDTDLDPKRAGTEPGLGKASGKGAAARAAVTLEEDAQDAPPPVDFDALHAALGDPLEYEELSSGPAIDKAASDTATGVSESSGATNATYASARPRTIPPTRAPAEDPNAPAVIVATDTDTVPTAPPQMTVPLGAPPQFGGAPHAQPGQPGSNPHVVAGAQRPPPSGPHGIGPGHPSSGPHAASPRASHPFTPQAFPVQARGAPQMTMRMPDRPIDERNMRRGRTPTIVVRPRGPSAKQKLVAFMAMLLLVTACGIAVIIWRKPRLLGLDPLLGAPPVSAPLPAVSAASSTGAVSPVSPIAPVTSGTTASSASSLGAGSAGAAVGASPSASVAASATVKKLPKPLAPVPHPTGSAAPLR